MNDITYRPYRPPSVMELLQGVTEPPQESKGETDSRVTNLYRRFRDNNIGFNEQAIELAVSPSTCTSELYKFYTKLEEKLNQRDSPGFISYIYPSRSRGTAFTLKFKPPEGRKFMETLSNMPEVKKVTETPKDNSAYSNTAHKFNVLLVQ